MKELSDVIATLEEQFEKSLNTKAPPVSLQGLHPSVEDEVCLVYLNTRILHFLVY